MAFMALFTQREREREREREIRGSESLDRLALTETENEILCVRQFFFFLRDRESLGMNVYKGDFRITLCGRKRRNGGLFVPSNVRT